MKKLLSLLCLISTTTGAFAQGTVIFANGPTTLMSYTPFGGPIQTLGPAPVGSYMYGLLISASATGPFTFSGVYATNTVAGNKLGPAAYQPAVTGWAAQTTLFFEVAGWSSDAGYAWKSGWLNSNGTSPNFGNGFLPRYFGLSNVGYGTSGGGLTPPAPVFGGTGVSGFVLYTLPEPSTAALVCLGFGAWLISRRGK